jgi:hypothetical protein
MTSPKCRLVLVSVLLLSCSSKEDAPDDPNGGAARLAVAPNALLMTAPGEQLTLTAIAYDAAEQIVEPSLPVTWTSSHPEVIEVTGDGTVLAVGDVGSAQIVAHLGELEAPPVTVLLAQLVPGAVLVGDAQIDGDIRTTSETTFDVTLHDVPDLAAGVIVVSREATPLAGRVTAVNGDDVAMEVVSVEEVFTALELNETYRVPSIVFDSDDPAYAVQALRSQLRAQATPPPPGNEYKFKLGPFDCKAEAQPKLNLALPIQMKLEPDVDVDFVLSFKQGSVAHHRFVVKGELVLTATSVIETTGVFSGSTKCELMLYDFVLPTGGAFSFLVAPTIPFGFGMSFDGSFTLAQMKFGLKGKLGAKTSLGYDYTPATGFTLVDTFDPIKERDTVAEWPGTLSEDIRLKAGVQGYFIAKLAVAAFPYLKAPEKKKIELLELVAGPRFELEYGTETAQATDTAFAAKYGLVLRARGGAGSTARDALKFLSRGLELSLPQITLDLPISSSPYGSLVAAKSAIEVDETVQLTITIDPSSTTFLGFDNVDSVQLKRLLPNNTLQDLGSRDAVAGQASYDIAWTPTSDDVGTNKLVAFVRPNILGFAVLPALEVKTNSAVIVGVTEPGTPAPLPLPGVYRYILGSGDCMNGSFRVINLFPNGAVSGSPLNDGECRNEVGQEYLAPIGSWYVTGDNDITIDWCNNGPDRSVTLTWDGVSLWRADDEDYNPNYKACLFQVQDFINPGTCIPGTTCIEIEGFVCDGNPVPPFTLACSGVACCDCVEPDAIPAWWERPVTCY